MQKTLIVTEGYPSGEQSVELNLSRFFDFPVYTVEQPGDKPKSIEVREFNVDVPPILGKYFKDAIERLRYAFWKPPISHDIVISSSLRTQSLVQWPDQHRIHYFHGIHRGSFGFPARDQYSNNAFLKTFQLANRMFIRTLNHASYDIIDTVVANSEFTAQMIERLYSTDVDEIIYPSFVEVDEYEHGQANGSYYLYLGRLVDAKGVREIVKAFNELELPLRVAGQGGLQSELNEVANDNVEILGYVSERKKRELLCNCKGLIHNTIAEPFGIVLAEALASGTPIVGSDSGNVPNIVEYGKTGVLFSREHGGETYQKPVSHTPIINAVREAESIEWDNEYIHECSKKYDQSKILEQWENLLNRIGGKTRY
jgi:glycosyltransferase involved in cell wall biosynthesis